MVIQITAEMRELVETTTERIENLMDAKDSITEDIREVYAQAKNEGIDTKALRKAIKTRRDLRKNGTTDEEANIMTPIYYTTEFVYQEYCNILINASDLV